MTGSEIAIILKTLNPVRDPTGFLASPLNLAAPPDERGRILNPDAELAASVLGWPLPICSAIVEAFFLREPASGQDPWPAERVKRGEIYDRQFDRAKRAGLTACSEYDEPGSTF